MTERCVTLPQGRSTTAVIQLLRGCAAGSVFLFHCQPFASVAPELQTLYAFGYCGVPVFFVVSGYCILGSALRLTGQPGCTSSFLRRRIGRIYPTYWASVLLIAASVPVSMVYNRFVYGTASYRSTAWMSWTWLDWLKVLSLTEIVDIGDLLPSQMNRFAIINGVYWTLGIEMQFYLVVAALLVLRASAVRWTLLFGMLSLMAAMIPGVAGSGLCFVYFPMFAMGALPWKAQSPRRDWCYIVAVPLVLSLLSRFMGFHSPDANEPFVAATTAGLLLAIRDFSRIDRLMAGFSACFAGRFVGWLGERSYSLYLIHAPIWNWLQSSESLKVVSPFARDTVSLAVVAVAVAVFHRVCEVPFLSRSERNNATSLSVRSAPGRPNAVWSHCMAVIERSSQPRA